MVFTCNKTSNQRCKYFSTDDTLLCFLDRIFGDDTIFMIKDNRYLRRKLESLELETGITKYT